MKECGISFRVSYTQKPSASTREFFDICGPEEGKFNVVNRSFTDGDTGTVALFHSLFRQVFQIAQTDCTRLDSVADGTNCTKFKIDRAFISLAEAAARDFHCYAHVFENLGGRSIPSDLAAVRVVMQKLEGKRIPIWMTKHPVFCYILKHILKQISGDHQSFWRSIRRLCRDQSHSRVSQKTGFPWALTEDIWSLVAKLLTASTALGEMFRSELFWVHRLSRTEQDYWKFHAWKESEREAEIVNFPWPQM